MLFGVVGRMGPIMYRMDRGADRRTGGGGVGVDMKRPIVTNGEFEALMCENV